MKKTVPFKYENSTFVFSDNEPDLALFLAMGRALSAAQCLEFGLASMVASIRSEEAEKLKKLTLGALLKVFERHNSDKEFLDDLREANKKRNYLVHRLLPKYGWPLMLEEHYRDAITELDEIWIYLFQASNELPKKIKEQGLLDLIIFEFPE